MYLSEYEIVYVERCQMCNKTNYTTLHQSFVYICGILIIYAHIYIYKFVKAN